MLTSLLLGGHLRDVAAIVLGSFERGGPEGGGRGVEALVRERTASLAVPVLGGAPFGHGPENDAFVLGRAASIAGDELRFE
jgi:muramoyltetrapeptide carboxypeptidase